jgi:hypothetical protein
VWSGVSQPPPGLDHAHSAHSTMAQATRFHLGCSKTSVALCGWRPWTVGKRDREEVGRSEGLEVYRICEAALPRGRRSPALGQGRYAFKTSWEIIQKSMNCFGLENSLLRKRTTSSAGISSRHTMHARCCSWAKCSY